MSINRVLITDTEKSNAALNRDEKIIATDFTGLRHGENRSKKTRNRPRHLAHVEAGQIALLSASYLR